MIEDWTSIEYVKQRLRCAKRRAVYWSGNPSFNPRARAVDCKRQHEFKYELALNDVHSIGCILAKLQDRAEPDRRAYDPKRDFGARFIAIMGELTRKNRK